LFLPNKRGRTLVAFPVFFWGRTLIAFPFFFARRLARIGSAVRSTNLGSLTLCQRFPKITKVLAPQLD
jgi:hypothetical protein